MTKREVNVQYVIEVVDLALAVIEMLSLSNDGPEQASALARRLNVSRGRVFRILKTLENRNYVVYDVKTRGYSLGLKLLEIGERARSGIDLRKVAQPYLQNLARATGDVAQLLVLRSGSAVCIDRYQGSDVWEGAAPVGLPLPLHVGASPKLLLAFLPSLERDRLVESLELTPLTPNSITDRKELYRRLVEIRSLGYSIDEQEYVQGVYAVGAPVRDRSGAVVAGITISTPSRHWSEKYKRELISLVTDAARKLSEQLGFEAPKDQRRLAFTEQAPTSKTDLDSEDASPIDQKV